MCPSSPSFCPSSSSSPSGLPNGEPSARDIPFTDDHALDGLDHVGTWLFDLDNTLYPATSSLFTQIDKKMKSFIAEFLKVPPEEAFIIQKDYFRKYGTTLRGLMLNHGLEPAQFLDYVHDVDHNCLIPNQRLDQALERLQGRKLIFTNGSEKHAENVLVKLGIERHFDGIFDIVAADYAPKPMMETYHKMSQRLHVDPREAAFFEDSQQNLKPAHELGMATVWVRESEDIWLVPPDSDLSHCQHIVKDLTRWLERVLAEVQKT